MTAAARLNLDGKAIAGEILDRCRPQIQLYTEKLLGRSGEVAVSKFKAKVQALFPVGFQNQSLELRDIEIIEVEAGSETSGSGEGGEDGVRKSEAKTAIGTTSFKANIKLE